MSEDKEYVDCYNCTGANALSMCGFPFFGCLLCETYGNGGGRLLKQYRNQTVEIKHRTDKGVLTTKQFVPPNYSCLFCKDTHLASYTIWVDSLVDDGCSDHGEHNMPREKLPCHRYQEKEHEEARIKLTEQYNYLI